MEAPYDGRHSTHVLCQRQSRSERGHIPRPDGQFMDIAQDPMAWAEETKKRLCRIAILHHQIFSMIGVDMSNPEQDALSAEA